MSGFIKVKAKELLLGNTLKLFLVFITSFVLKVTSIISIVLFTHFSLVSSFLQNLVATYNSLLIYFIYSLIIVTLYFLLFLFLSGLKLGEKAIFFMQSKGSNAKFKYLFIFLKPSQSIRAFLLYFTTFFLKINWFIFFYMPPLFCLLLTIFLYFNSYIYTAVFYTLLFGTVILLSISRFFYNCTIIRYSYASYYLCTDLKISVSEAISKSTENTDGFIKDGVFLKASFLPWILSCILILPLFYVIPFIQLTKAKFVTFTDGLHKALPQNFIIQSDAR
jgi:hypothetical protein